MSILESVGRGTIERVEYVGGLTIQFVRGIAVSWRANPITGSRQRWRATVRHMAVVGVHALPVVCLIAGATGLIMAMTGGAELRRFGAMQFVVNLVAVSITRELGPLITAIVVVGRSGSAFSAEIGTMVVTEEVDALRSMALDPIEFLLVPKHLAMMVMMPCLTIVANASGILAGGIFVYFALDMNLRLYLNTVLEVLVLRDIVSGLIKSVAFATIIVQVGCYEGFHVSGGPEGVGRATTSAVVKSIFLVVLADLFFTAFFYFFWS